MTVPTLSVGSFRERSVHKIGASGGVAQAPRTNVAPASRPLLGTGTKPFNCEFSHFAKLERERLAGERVTHA